MGVKLHWTLALFVIIYTSQSQGKLTKERITKLSLTGGMRSPLGYRGRVIIQINNEDVDGAICGTWTRQDAIVVCRMLGYNDGNNEQSDGLIPPENHNFRMSNVRCTGQETSLFSCPRDPIVNCIYDAHDVAVSCSNPGPNPLVTYISGVAVEVNRETPAPLQRLTGMFETTHCQIPNPNIRLHGVEGRKGMGYVQVNVNGVWQYICDDKWSENDAKVVCKELCYNEPTCARPGVENEYKPYLDQTATFAWNRVQCTGDESNLIDCVKNNTTPQGECGQHELAGVQCVVPTEIPPAMNAELDCANLNGDIVLNFTRNNFPNENASSIRIANVPAGCSTRAQRDSQRDLYFLRIPTEGCGTVKTDNGSQICYKNTVEYENEVSRGNVLFDYKKKTFSVSCCMPTDKDISIKFIPRTQEYAQSISHNFDYVPEISFYQNERCDEKITQNPYAVQVGDWVYIGVSVNANNESLFRDSDLKLVVTRCTANPINGVDNGPKPFDNVTLIDNKCPSDLASVTTYPISNTTEGFRFRAFKFFGYSSVYVTCHLRVCLSTERKPDCDRSCAQNNIGRKRRNLADEVTGLDTVVSQILQITDPKQPPVNALPAQSHEDRTAESINPRFLKP
ncbi:unnamed protein product [Lymnaea stagnalis]|uniref:Uncharacterized protein n=1 Tax=Lymnaea stagnalis TaxID=6523 RepID=A0AAV2HV19_LYMST